MSTLETEIQIIRRAFPESQRLLERVPAVTLGDNVDVGWYGPGEETEEGASAVVRASGVFAAEVGQILRLSSASGSCFVYVVLTSSSASRDLMIGRRAFMALGLLAHASLPCRVERCA